ncbi:MAG TPA: cupin domain-containing protein [Acidimicrobiia bacterium]
MAEINHGNEKREGNPDWFTGRARITPLSEPTEPDGVRVLVVEFSPGSRSKWHSHPGGQVLHVLSGEGVVANRDGQRIAMTAGDTVTAAPDEVHWHGASPSSQMLQMSITSQGPTEWTGEEVGEDEYREAVDDSAG